MQVFKRPRYTILNRHPFKKTILIIVNALQDNLCNLFARSFVKNFRPPLVREMGLKSLGPSRERI